MVVSDSIAIVVGQVDQEAIAIRTTDGGRTWTSLRTAAGKWQSWSAAADGSVVLMSGSRKKMRPAPGGFATVDAAQAWFAPADGKLSEPAPLFPNDDKLKGVAIQDGVARPALLTADLASVVAERNRSPIIVFGAPGGSQQPDPISPPHGRWIHAAYGRAPNLLSVAGSSLQVRPWPRPGEQLRRPSTVPGLTVTGAMASQLDAGPTCDAGAFSFARVASAPTNAYLVGVSDTRAFAFKLPAGDEQRLGCSTNAVVVEVMGTTKDAGTPAPQLVRCTLDGVCAEPQSQPFDLWPEKHTRKILAVPTHKGVVATMTARAGNRNGAYLATSTDEGKTFDLPRVIGETQTGRGYFEIGALIAFDDRVVMLISADVTGTRGRRWYAMASNDGGENWGPP